jgi:hypothetical protein
MLAATTPLSPLLTLRLAAAPSLYVEQNLDDEISARLEASDRGALLAPQGQTEITDRCSPRRFELLRAKTNYWRPGGRTAGPQRTDGAGGRSRGS